MGAANEWTFHLGSPLSDPAAWHQWGTGVGITAASTPPRSTLSSDIKNVRLRSKPFCRPRPWDWMSVNTTCQHDHRLIFMRWCVVQIRLLTIVRLIIPPLGAMKLNPWDGLKYEKSQNFDISSWSVTLSPRKSLYTGTIVTLLICVCKLLIAYDVLISFVQIKVGLLFFFLRKRNIVCKQNKYSSLKKNININTKTSVDFENFVNPGYILKSSMY